MIKIKYFTPEQAEEANSFMSEHPARDDKGLVINPSGIFIVYDDGQGLSKVEKLSICSREIGNYESQLLGMEPTMRYLTSQIKESEDLIPEAEKALTMLNPNSKDKKEKQDWREKEGMLRQLKTNHEANLNNLLSQEFTRTKIKETLEICKTLLLDIQEDAY